MKKLAILACSLVLMTNVMAQNTESKERPDNTPKSGSIAVGLSFNALGLGKAVSQPGNGSAAGDFVSSTEAFTSRQMSIFTQDPLASLRIKIQTGKNLAVRVGVGFSGSKVDYREYIDDDAAKALNPLSEKQVEDIVHSNLNTVSANVGAEYKIGAKNVQFVMGFGLNYVVGGGKMNIEYGNKMTSINTKPSTVGMLETPADGTLNDYSGTHMGIVYARPTERYSQGYCQGVGLSFDLGIEWFFVKNASLQANIGIIPVMFCFQPQTWAKFEGYSSISNKIESYTDMISPGSNAILYGTQNIGLNFGLNYYF